MMVAVNETLERILFAIFVRSLSLSLSLSQCLFITAMFSPYQQAFLIHSPHSTTKNNIYCETWVAEIYEKQSARETEGGEGSSQRRDNTRARLQGNFL